MRRVKLAFLIYFFLFFSHHAFSEWKAYSYDANQYILNICLLYYDECKISGSTIFYWYGDSCPEGQSHNDDGFCTNDECPTGQTLTQFNSNTPYCSDLDCSTLLASLNFDAVCYDAASAPDNQGSPSCDSGVQICLSSANDIPDSYNPTSDNSTGSLGEPDTNSSTTTTSETSGDETTTTQTTTVNEGDVSTTTISETTVNNITGSTTTTTTTISTNNTTGETISTVTGSSSDSQPDENNNTASGGQSCSVNPLCSGDAIQCAMLYQQWKTRCAINELKKEQGVNEISLGETCETPPVRGDNVTDSEWQTVIQNYKLRCPSIQLKPITNDYDFGDTAEVALQEKQEEYRDFIDKLKNDIKASFSFNLSGSGTLTDNHVSIRGVDVSFGIAKFSEGLSIISAFFIAAAYILAFFIIFRASTR